MSLRVLWLGAALLVFATRTHAQTEFSPMELGRAHSQCHAIRLLLPSAGMDHVAFLERHKRGHYLSLSPIFGAYKSAIDADYELGYALAAEGRVAQNRLFETFCASVEGHNDNRDPDSPFGRCVNELRLLIFDPTSATDEFTDFALQDYEQRNCASLPVPMS